jgi:hypothetical protein
VASRGKAASRINRTTRATSRMTARRRVRLVAKAARTKRKAPLWRGFLLRSVGHPVRTELLLLRGLDEMAQARTAREVTCGNLMYENVPNNYFSSFVRWV